MSTLQMGNYSSYVTRNMTPQWMAAERYNFCEPYEKTHKSHFAIIRMILSVLF